MRILFIHPVCVAAPVGKKGKGTESAAYTQPVPILNPFRMAVAVAGCRA